MTFITVMATQAAEGELVLDSYKINREQVLFLRDLPSRTVAFYNESGLVSLFSPIVEIALPGFTLFASGVADELIARST